MPTSIEVGDFVDVTLTGPRPVSLPQYEVLQVPSNAKDYWEFGGPKGDVVAFRSPIVTKRSP